MEEQNVVHIEPPKKIKIIFQKKIAKNVCKKTFSNFFQKFFLKKNSFLLKILTFEKKSTVDKLELVTIRLACLSDLSYCSNYSAKGN